MNRNYACALLAGGQGSRMGRVSKAELEYSGRTFAETIGAELIKTGLPCYVSLANYDSVKLSGWRAVRDIVTGAGGEYIGSMGGIEFAGNWWSHGRIAGHQGMVCEADEEEIDIT